MSDIPEKLAQLADLVEKGFITREQFDEQRDAILAAERQRASAPSNPGAESSILASAQAPDSLGSYTILGEIGQGGMGVVYRARHRSASFAERQGGDVALKVLHAQYASRADVVQRFEREAELGIKLDHPGIVRAFELVVDSGRVALVMEFLEGQPLSDLIGSVTGPIPWARARPMVQELLEAVGYAHSQGVVHRDLKPENVMVGPDGHMKVLDFGIAKDLSAGRTKTGTGMGTVDYMAPEQFTDAKTVDARADIYALGMTVYEMLAGRLPWESGATDFDVMQRKARGELPPPTDFYPDIPPHVVAVTQRMLNEDVDDRQASCSEVWADFEDPTIRPATAAPTPQPPTAPTAAPTPTPQPPAEPTAHPPVTPDAPVSPASSSSRGPLIVIGAVLALGAIGAVAATQMDDSRPEKRERSKDDDDDKRRKSEGATGKKEGATGKKEGATGKKEGAGKKVSASVSNQTRKRKRMPSSSSRVSAPTDDGRDTGAGMPMPVPADLNMEFEDAVQTIQNNQRLDDSQLLYQDCTDLWALRNWVYARHGYRFKYASTQQYFAARSDYHCNERIHAKTIKPYLTSTDKRNVDTVQDAEEAKWCDIKKGPEGAPGCP